MANAKGPPAPRRWRWVRRVLGAFLIAVAAATVALPWLLSTGAARRFIVARANGTLAPARLELAAIRLSWLHPAELRGLVLRDAEGDAVIASDSATWHRTLGQILFARPRLGTFEIHHARLDVERRADGSVDLYEALRPIIGRDPRTEVHIRIPQARLRFRNAGQRVPVTAEEADVALDVLPKPRLLSWRLKLANRKADGPETLEIQGDYDRWPPSPDVPGDLTLDIQGHRWLWAIDAGGFATRGQLEGRIGLERRSGLLGLAGDAVLTGLEATGPGLPLDLVRLDRISGSWQVARTPKGWVVERLDLGLARSAEAPENRMEGRLVARGNSGGLDIEQLQVKLGAGQGPFGLDVKGRYDRDRGRLVLTQAAAEKGPAAVTLGTDGIRVSGLEPGGKLNVSAGLSGDLELLARIVKPSEGTYEGPFGTWSARASVEPSTDTLRITGTVNVLPTSKAGEPRNEDRVSLTLGAAYQLQGDRLEVSEFDFRSRYGALDGSGSVSDLRGRRVAELGGMVAPDWAAINGLLVERVEPRAHLSGKPRPWRIRGPLADASPGDRFKALDIELGLDLAEADIYGMHIGATPLVVKSRGGKLTVDPIDTTINGGRIHAEPELSVADGQTRLRFGPSTWLRDAEINDEVSSRFLSYVAPVLDRATRVHGRVSVALDEAVFPIGREKARDATVEGQVLFQDVEFLPGPFAEELFAIVSRDELPGLKLNEPVALSIADRRVHQRGLAIPLGKVTRIELDGWVDFDQNLKMTASLPITPAMVGNVPVLSELVQGKRISVPIAGTLRKPQIDKQTIDVALKDLGKTFLDNDAVKGAAELLDRILPRRDPNAPPRPTPRERREMRRERRAERRENRGLQN